MVYLSQRALKGLRDYKYKPGGYTILDNLHQPVWNWCTENLLPLWLAPNCVTLLGTAALVTAYVVAAIELPEYADNGMPHWIAFMSACAVFFYLHMDCLDGKQARRTKNSSPLGQLFDHGCDALAMHLVLSNIICSLNLVPGWRPIIGSLICFLPWILAHWEEYHTGIMVYGNGVIGVTEANYAVVVLHLIASVVGPVGWSKHPLAWLAAVPAVRWALPAPLLRFAEALQFNEVLMATILYFALVMVGEQMFRVFRLAGTKHLEHTTLPKNEQGNKQLGKRAAAWHLAQLLFMFGLGFAQLSLADKGPWQPRVSHAIFGIQYAMQATRLIMAHMAKEPYNVAIWPLVLMAVQTANAVLRIVNPVPLGLAILAAVVLGYLHYVISMINEICGFLNIPCLRVRKVVD